MNQASNQPPSKRQHKYTLKLEARDKRYLAASIVLHVVVAVILFSSWEFTESVTVKPLPTNIQARVLTAEELKQLNAKKLTERKAIEDKKKAAQKKKEQERLKAKKKKEAERKKKQEAKKKAEAKKKEEARKKALIQKKEKQKKDKEKQTREKKAREDKAKKEKARKEAERKEALKRKEREKRLAERLKAADDKAAQDKQAEDQRRMQELLAEQNRASLAQELDEVEKYKSLIYSRIVSRWHVPPHVKNKRVELQIRLLPTGELVAAKITKRSGHAAFDQSALNAAQSLRRYPVPSSASIFDKHFRQFKMGFTPPSE